MPRASLSKTEIEATRIQLQAAALQLYKKEGFDAVSFRKLANLTGSSHTQPYRYFDNKEQLFAGVRVDCYRRFARLIREHDRPSATPAQRLEAIHAAILDYVRAEPAEYQLMFSMEQPPLEDYPALLSVRRQAFEYLVSIVQIAVDEGKLQGDARDLMHVAWSAVHGMLSLHTAGQLVHGRKLEALTQPLLYQVFTPLFDAPMDTKQSRQKTA